jgi:hypothetical protein
MNMPGYTAEASLYQTKTNYRQVGVHSRGAGEVVPQLTRVCTACSSRFSGTRRCCDLDNLLYA